MAPKTHFSLSSISPFSILPNFTSPNPNIIRLYPSKPFLITCKSTKSQTYQNPPSYETNFPGPEPEGSGAAAPTRGDVFLEHQQALAASAAVLATNKKKKKKDKLSGSMKVSTLIPTCYGCGAPLQTLETDAPGYVDTDTYALKKKHHQLRTVLCGRCQLLSHGHMITAVGGNGGYSGGKQFVSAEELREKLSHLRHQKVLIVKLWYLYGSLVVTRFGKYGLVTASALHQKVDIVDFNGSFLARVRDMAGANPIILVVTKVDLLPKGTDFNCVGDWVVEATMKKKLNVLSVHLTSSKSLVGITGVVSEIQKEKKGRDVYILTMSYKDPVAALAQRYRPIQSAVPGTTVGPIKIDAFMGDGKLYDTPGVHLHHRQAAVVHSDDLPALAPRSRLRGQSFSVSQVVLDQLAVDKIESNGLNGFSLFWGGLVRIDLLKVLPKTCLTFYGPKALKIHMVPTDKADEFYKKEVGVLLTPPTGKQDGWLGLETEHQLQIKFQDPERPACDVAISGLGWVTVEPVSKYLKTTDSSLEGTTSTGELLMAIHVPKPVEIFVRPPLPVGKAGGEWYQYRELTEKEQEIRPKWFF
ncbi:hypothetical protein LguiB_003530 [Lonicera macranthoides]